MAPCHILLAASLLPLAIALRDQLAFQVRSTHFGQQLYNINDQQYTAEISIGGQTVQAVLASGSFQTVVLSKACNTCGGSAVFDEQASRTLTRGNLSSTVSWGSSGCTVVNSVDTLSLGPLDARADIWLATGCDLPALESGAFGAVVGLAPPGGLEFVTRQRLEGADVTEGTEVEHLRGELEVAKRPLFLESFGVKVFSTCLGSTPGSPGWLVWNDDTHMGKRGMQQIPVVGNITWGVWLSHLALQRETFGCQSGCGAIIDSGSSLFAVPTIIYDELMQAVRDHHADCRDLRKFPDLVMNLGGQRLWFPPSSYVGSIHGRMSREVSRFFRTNNSLGLGSACQLLVMDLGEVQQTVLGPMVVLGMPFFREYYTTFDLGSGRGDRSIRVSTADGQCEPRHSWKRRKSRRDVHAFTPRRVDASQLRVPAWVKGLGVSI